MEPSRRIRRPWGWYECVAEGEGYRVKRIYLDPRSRISLQSHRHRCEHWVVVRGSGLLECDGEQVDADVGATLFIPRGAWHRASAADAGLLFIEIQRGPCLLEGDIQRHADDYGRAEGP